MPTDDDSVDSHDSVLRAIAAAPDVSPEPENPLAPARVGHFRIVDLLGRGGMGSVFRAEDERLRRFVALKLLHGTRDPERRLRFIREARAAAAVAHPNVTTIFEVDEADGRAYIAMELVAGETLRQLIARGPIPIAKARALAHQIAAGLGAAHEVGVVHRDLKPENVMVMPDGVVKLVDFGLAKTNVAARRSEATGPPRAGTETLVTVETARLMGTPAYMSPEQALGEPADARADVFSLGIMLYELFGGVRPFGGTTTGAILTAIALDPPIPLRTLVPELDEATASVVMRCLSKRPEERFATAGAVAGVLRVSAVDTSVSSSKAGRRSRRIALWGLFAAIALGGALCGVTKSRMQVGSVAASAAVPSAPPHPTTLANLPLPASTVPEAIAEYRIGIQLVRDDSYNNAAQHFAKAAELDPSMALAHLRMGIAILQGTEPDRGRAELAKTMGLRAQLGERDRILLEAIEPAEGRSEPDLAQCLARLEAAHERYPQDEEFAALLAEYSIDDPVRGPAMARVALALDPEDASAWEALGRSLALSGDLEGGHRALERCASVSAESSDCYLWLSFLDGAMGRCNEMERGGRRAVDYDPGLGSIALAYAAVALGRPEAFVRDALIRSSDIVLPELRRMTASVHEAQLAVLEADVG